MKKTFMKKKHMTETHIHHSTAFDCLGDIQHEFSKKTLQIMCLWKGDSHENISRSYFNLKYTFALSNYEPAMIYELDRLHEIHPVI